MQRLMEAGHAKHFFLETQYRMHPSIAAFPSRRFYDSRLVNAPVTESDERMAPWSTSDPSLGPWSFVNIATGVEARDGSGSLRNPAEVAAVVSICQALRDTWGVRVRDPASLRVLTFYAAQVRALKRALAQAGLAGVAVSTVDGSQGAEAETIILSFVRAPVGGNGGGRGGGGGGGGGDGDGNGGGGGSSSIGFVSDWRRLNVAITRARRALVMVGHAGTLLRASRGGAASDLVRTARALGRVYNGVGGDAEPAVREEEDAAVVNGLQQAGVKSQTRDGEAETRRQRRRTMTGPPSQEQKAVAQNEAMASESDTQSAASMQARIDEMAAFVRARKEEEVEKARKRLAQTRSATAAFHWVPPDSYQVDED